MMIELNIILNIIYLTFFNIIASYILGIIVGILHYIALRTTLDVPTLPSTSSIPYLFILGHVLFEQAVFIYVPTYFDMYWVYVLSTLCFVFWHINWGMWLMWTRLAYIPLCIYANRTYPYTSVIAHLLIEIVLNISMYKNGKRNRLKQSKNITSSLLKT